ncbi:MAG TPA: FMN-binding protein [Anaerolineae bacterium]|nr:FMN-binding protein [Anaerolineae bacterium]
MVGLWIALGVVAALGAAGGIGWSLLMKEHREARGLPLDAVDFSILRDGSYRGLYEGGMYKWRRNECDVTVAGGRVTAIQLTASKDPGRENTTVQPLYDRVIHAQSLQVDTISGATLTSKAYLQAVENALLQAQGD